MSADDRWIIERGPSARYPLYTRGNIGEVNPGPRTPLSWTFFLEGVLEPAWREAWVEYGAFDLDEFGDEPVVILGCFGGYAYINASLTRVLAVRTPGVTPEEVDYSLFGEHPGVPAYKPEPSDDSARHSERIAQTLGWILSADELPELIEEQQRVARLRAERPDLGALSDAALVARMHQLVPLLHELVRRHVFISFCSTIAIGVFGQACSSFDTPGIAMQAIAGVGDIDSTAPSIALWDLSRAVVDAPELSAAFDAGLDGLLERLPGLPGGKDFLVAFDAFLFDYGSRGGPDESEMLTPTWESEPRLALTIIDRLRMAGPDASPGVRHERQVEDRRALVARMELELVDEEARAQFRSALHTAELFLVARERTKTTGIRAIHEVRMTARELARRMVERGCLGEIADLGMLKADELDPFLADPSAFVDVIAERKDVVAAQNRLEPPFVVDGEVPPLDQWRSASREAPVDPARPGDILPGIVGSPGRATGRARIITDPSDPRGLEPGDILVAPATDPGWTPLFVPAGAVVVDVGAQVSHAVVVSREFGIPCVVSVADASRRIPDGALVTVDGGAGTVTIEVG